MNRVQPVPFQGQTKFRVSLFCNTAAAAYYKIYTAERTLATAKAFARYAFNTVALDCRFGRFDGNCQAQARVTQGVFARHDEQGAIG